MPDQADPLFSRKHLRISLRQRRERRELTQKQVAQALDWSESKVVRIESGAVRVSTTDLRALLALYETTQENEISRFVELARAARGRPWYSEHESALDPDFAEYLGYEGSATMIATFQPLLIPGLLQTEDYARAVMTANGASHLEDRLRVRFTRQARLAREEGPSLQCVIDEAALHRQVGGPAVMREQLIRLKEASGPRISVRIVPFTAGAHPSMTEPFTILVVDPEDPEDVLFREAATRTVTSREDHDLLAGYTIRFKHLHEMSVEHEQARLLIDNAIQGLRDAVPASQPG
jgi:transcriptional regulator with XRE-family HTH domain